MTTTHNRIECPNCQHEVDVNRILHQKLEADLKKKYNRQLKQQQVSLEEERRKIADTQAAIEAREKEIEEQIRRGIDDKLRCERQKIIDAERIKAESAQSDSIAMLEKELHAQQNKVKELHKTRTEIAKLQREKDALKLNLEAENEIKFNAALADERVKIQQRESQRNELRVSEKEHIIKQLRDQLTQAQQKAEQGSVQTQGEVQELAVERWLQSQFALDAIEEINKGALGGDCVQIVNTRERQNCGTIYYESKRTKSFQTGWIEKFKADIQRRNADIGVLVTAAMPADMDRMGMRDGIWICTYEEFKGLSQVLRQTLIQLDRAVVSRENRGDKMHMLYDYLSGNEFRQQVESIVEGFTQMQMDLDKEKRSMQGHWKKREKQIDRVLTNTTYMYSTVRGIAGSAIPEVPALEMDNYGVYNQ